MLARSSSSCTPSLGLLAPVYNVAVEYIPPFWQDPNHDRGSRPIVHRYAGRAEHGCSPLVLPGAGLGGSCPAVTTPGTASSSATSCWRSSLWVAAWSRRPDLDLPSPRLNRACASSPLIGLVDERRRPEAHVVVGRGCQSRAHQ